MRIFLRLLALSIFVFPAGAQQDSSPVFEDRSLVQAFEKKDKAGAAQLLDGNPLVLERHLIGAALQVYVDHGDEALPALLRLVAQGHFPAKSVHLSRPSLDDVFLKLTGRSLRETEGGQEGRGE